MLLSQAINMFIDNQKLIGNSEKTILYYKNQLKYLTNYLGDVNIQNITIQNLNDYKIHVQDKKSERKRNLLNDVIASWLLKNVF